MTRRSKRLALILLGLAVLTACASSGTISSLSAGKSPAATGTMSAGMVMPDGSTMGAPIPAGAATQSATAASAAAVQPAASTSMVCTDDIRTIIAKVLAVPSIPVGTSTWTNQLYTCTYQLPMGTLVLSVKQTADTDATDTYFATLRQQLGTTNDLAGLGQAAYGTNTGTVVLRKDNDVLDVDATALPAQFGSQQEKRNDFAYEIASDILGCWTGG